MRLYQFIKKYNFNIDTYWSIYGQAHINACGKKDCPKCTKEHYQKGINHVIEILKQLKPIKNKYIITISECESCGETWESVYGVLPDKDETYALEFMIWDKWLGMTISQHILLDYTPEEIYSHIIWEMTWNGWGYNGIIKKQKELEKALKESFKEKK